MRNYIFSVLPHAGLTLTRFTVFALHSSSRPNNFLLPSHDLLADQYIWINIPTPPRANIIYEYYIIFWLLHTLVWLTYSETWFQVKQQSNLLFHCAVCTVYTVRIGYESSVPTNDVVGLFIADLHVRKLTVRLFQFIYLPSFRYSLILITEANMSTLLNKQSYGWLVHTVGESLRTSVLICFRAYIQKYTNSSRNIKTMQAALSFAP